MFCNGCGTTLQAGQKFCSNCGRELLGPIEAAQVYKSRVFEHIRLLGILWIAYSAFHLAGGIVLMVLGNTLFLHMPMHGAPFGTPMFIHTFMIFLGIFLLAKATFGILAGVGLLKKEPWARMLTIVLSFFALFMNIPFGTALGVYTLWVPAAHTIGKGYDAVSASANPVAVKGF